MHLKKLYLLLLLLPLLGNKTYAQNDTLIFKNSNVIVGEIKSFSAAVIKIKTNYSDEDFQIEWKGVKEIYSSRIFFAMLKEGNKITGSVHSIPGTGKVVISHLTGETTEASINDLVFLKPFDTKFWSKFSGNIDIGFSFTEDNHLKQLNSNNTIGYLARKWYAQVYNDLTLVTQDSANETQRTDVGLSYDYFLPKDWYILFSPTFYSSNEQAILLRFVGKSGVGKFLANTNRNFWGVAAGASFNNETYTNETPTRQSLELFAGTQSNLYDVAKFSFTGALVLYRSLTESKRWRGDFKFDAKYKFTSDFHVKAGISLNYDNQPAVSGNETSYQLNTSIGWDFD